MCQACVGVCHHTRVHARTHTCVLVDTRVQACAQPQPGAEPPEPCCEGEVTALQRSAGFIFACG